MRLHVKCKDECKSSPDVNDTYINAITNNSVEKTGLEILLFAIAKNILLPVERLTPIRVQIELISIVPVKLLLSTPAMFRYPLKIVNRRYRVLINGN